MSANHHIQQLIRHGIELHANHELEEAIIIYKRILVINPNNLLIINNLAEAYLEKKLLNEAIRLLTRLRIYHLTPQIFITSYKKLSIQLLNHGYKKQALEWVRYIHSLQNGDAESDAIIKNISTPNYLEPFAYDFQQKKWLERYAPYEKNNYTYAIDIVGTCNLKCPSCPVANMADDLRPKGFMSVDLFMQILEKIKRESPVEKPDIWLFNWGEPLLHPELKEIIQAIKVLGWPVMVSTNLNIKKGLDKLIESRPTSIKISLSGMSEKTYPSTHVRGDIDLVKSNLYLIKMLMNKYQSHLPDEEKSLIYIGYHLYKDNLAEAKIAADLASELGFGYAENPATLQPVEKVMAVLDNQHNPTDSELVEKLLTHPRKMAQEVAKKRSGKYDCELRFNMTTINHDGSVGLCCSTYSHTNQIAKNFMTVSHQDLEEIKYNHPFCKKCMNLGLSYSLCDVVTE